MALRTAMIKLGLLLNVLISGDEKVVMSHNIESDGSQFTFQVEQSKIERVR